LETSNKVGSSLPAAAHTHTHTGALSCGDGVAVVALPPAHAKMLKLQERIQLDVAKM